MSKIITFEGIDGSGKTTLVQALYHHFATQGKVVWPTNEPWSISEIDPDPFVATMQLMADRRHHCNVLKSTSYNIALIDRFDLSTMAYQGYGDGINRDMINTLNVVATRGVIVNLRIWLDLPVDIAVKRLEQRGEKVSAAEVDRLTRIYDGYATLYNSRLVWRRMVRIDATQPPDDVLREAIALIDSCNPGDPSTEARDL
jgi:dTMP kinase